MGLDLEFRATHGRTFLIRALHSILSSKILSCDELGPFFQPCGACAVPGLGALVLDS